MNFFCADVITLIGTKLHMPSRPGYMFLRSLSVRFHILQRYLYAYKPVENAAQIELRVIWDAVEQEQGAKKCKYRY